MPCRETLLGPLRDWDRPKILRSRSVIRAIFTKTGIISHNIEIN